LSSDFERSGSCALIVIILDDVCYVANLGDSRCLLSENGGSRLYQLSKDHKPNDVHEKARISSAGGYIYKAQSSLSSSNLVPWRIFPGRLSVNL
jgi:protein phosphatase 2C family protein 2/3